MKMFFPDFGGVLKNFLLSPFVARNIFSNVFFSGLEFVQILGVSCECIFIINNWPLGK